MARFHGLLLIQRLGTLDFEESLPRQGKTEIRYTFRYADTLVLFSINSSRNGELWSLRSLVCLRLPLSRAKWFAWTHCFRSGLLWTCSVHDLECHHGTIARTVHVMKTAVRTKARLLHSRKDGVFIETVAKLSMKCMKNGFHGLHHLPYSPPGTVAQASGVSLVHPLVHFGP